MTEYLIVLEPIAGGKIVDEIIDIDEKTLKGKDMETYVSSNKCPIWKKYDKSKYYIHDIKEVIRRTPKRPLIKDGAYHPDDEAL